MAGRSTIIFISVNIVVRKIARYYVLSHRSPQQHLGYSLAKKYIYIKKIYIKPDSSQNSQSNHHFIKIQRIEAHDNQHHRDATSKI